ncbi:MAG: hypothetical protein R3265_16470, partial [Hyphomonas sp.]|nr:hypothetical protein [Hyphomonas sp.]
AIYFALGIMLCIIVATGLNIYFLKRREKGRAAPRLEAMWSGWIWGSTVMFPVTLIASLFGVGGVWLIALYWLGAIAFAGAATVWMSAASAGRLFRLMFGVTLLAAPILHLVRGDVSWTNTYALTISATLLVAGALFVARSLAAWRAAPGQTVLSSGAG